MGKQIRFYMTNEDEDEFLDFVRSTGDVVILPQTTDKAEGEEFTSFRDLSGRILGDDSHLWNRSISPKPIIEYYDAHGGCYCLDFMQSEVVNVISSKQIGNELSMGRLHVEDVLLYPDGLVVEKGEEFLKWFDELSRWLRKSYPKSFDRARLSARAEALSKSGVELLSHRF